MSGTPLRYTVSINVDTPHPENITVGKLGAKYSAAGDRVLRFYMDFRHKILDLHKELSAPEIEILQNKVDALMALWDKKFEAHQKKASLAAGKKLAEDKTVEAEEMRNNLRNILRHTLDINDEVDWEILKDRSTFKKEKFSERKPMEPENRPEPMPIKIGFFQELFGQRKRIEAEFHAKKLAYKETKREEDEKYKQKNDAWHMQKSDWDKNQFEKERKFEEKRVATNGKVDTLKNSWLAGSDQAILEHANIVLDASDYDELISKEFEVQYEAENKCLMIDYTLPSPDNLPITKVVRFVTSTGELKETEITEKDKKILFEDICYQICLRTIHELFEADLPGNLQSILFNGSTDYIDKATGRETHATIMSLLVNREEFLAINLENVDPKTCFKNLKGVSGASLIGLAPIAPIMEINKDDRRFVDAQKINLGDDGATNLAAMDWEEFEHLVRELFDKEFASRGGEVKITQSSSDGGVDAVAFDPDPISGGKIIIQAKRYTKTVGVAAVRDLYGTTMNEGANKGILVTTADYGPDAYKFASDKPLTLMTGANLLHLLEKHGIQAKIDLRLARKELGLREKGP